MSEATIVAVILVIGLGIAAVLIATMFRAIVMERRSAGIDRIWANFGLSISFLALFLLSWIGQAVAEWGTYVQDVRAHGEAPAFAGYIVQFGQSTLENWQSEFLQLFAFVVFSAIFDPPRERRVEGRGGPHRAGPEEDREAARRRRDRFVRVVLAGLRTPSARVSPIREAPLRELMPDRSTTRDVTALPGARGPSSEAILELLGGGEVEDRRPSPPEDPLGDDDLHLALYLAYELHYRGLPGVEDDREWDPDPRGSSRARGLFEAGLRRAIEIGRWSPRRSPRRSGTSPNRPERVRCRRSSNGRRPWSSSASSSRTVRPIS